MKFAVLSGAVVFGGYLAGIAGGHPHHLRRDLITEVAYTTVNLANVIVWVDENGVPYETTTVDQVTTVQTLLTGSTFTTSSLVGAKPAPVESPVVSSAEPSPAEAASSTVPVNPAPPVITPDSAPTSKAPSSSTPTPFSQSIEIPTIAPAPAPASPPPPASSQVPSPSPSPQLAPEPRPQEASDDRLPIGVTYDPFKSGACKTEQDIRDEWAQMTKYGIVRIYGMACNIVPLAVRLAEENNQKVFAGIWLAKDGSNEKTEDVVSALTSAVRDYAGGNWDIVKLVSVENERVNDGAFTASEVVDAINRARQALRFAGYNGPVGAVETVPAMLDNPTICKNSDLAMVNVHSFFDQNTKAEDSGKFVRDRVGEVKDKCGGKRVIVTEAGWPHQGDSHGAAVASRENQKKAIDSVLSLFDHDLFLFNAFDSPWKSDWAGSFNAERYWGIFD